MFLKKISNLSYLTKYTQFEIETYKKGGWYGDNGYFYFDDGDYFDTEGHYYDPDGYDENGGYFDEELD